MGASGIAASLAFLAGIAGAVQIATQGTLGGRVGTLEALACSFVIGAVATLIVLLLVRRSLDGVHEGLASPKWMLLGGPMSVVIVLAISITGPRIGVVATTAFVIAGQFGLATVIDRFGWFGLQQVALGWPRVIGIALLVAGAALTLRR